MLCILKRPRAPIEPGRSQVGAHFYTPPMSKRGVAFAVYPDGRRRRIPLGDAETSVSCGAARAVSSHPFTIELIPVLRVRSALIPADCREFRDEYLRCCARSAGRTPRHAISPEWVAVQRLKAVLDRAIVPTYPDARGRPSGPSGLASRPSAKPCLGRR